MRSGAFQQVCRARLLELKQVRQQVVSAVVTCSLGMRSLCKGLVSSNARHTPQQGWFSMLDVLTVTQDAALCVEQSHELKTVTLCCNRSLPIARRRADQV